MGRDNSLLNVAHWLERSVVNGPGERFVLWVQGCGLHCPGCWNPDTWSFEPKHLKSTKEVMDLILSIPELEGVTFSGGEPFVQASALAPLASQIKKAGLSLMIFTGYELEELRSAHAHKLLASTDILVSGRFRLDKKKEGLVWRGSSNQQVHFLSNRYNKLDMVQNEMAEVHIFSDGKVIVSGFPTEALSSSFGMSSENSIK